MEGVWKGEMPTSVMPKGVEHILSREGRTIGQ